MPDTSPRTGRLPTWFLLQIILIAGLAVIAVSGLASGSAGSGGFSDRLEFRLGIDRLSGGFLLLICVLGLASALAGLGERRRYGWLGLVFVGAMSLFVLARDVLTFLAAWELMSLAPAAAILAQRQDDEARKTVLIYMGTTHLCGAGAWLGMLYMADHGLLSGTGGELPLAIAIATMIGFAAKAGLAPLHFWLPRAHPLAPAPISALMSGVMITLPLYATMRLLFEWIAPAPAGLGWGLIVAGAASALIGAYCAVMSGEMKRLLAFSSIENIGLVAVAIGLAAVMQAQGIGDPAGLVLAVALFQILAHGMAKSALFIAGGVLSERLGGLDLDRLGGLGSRMPRTSIAMVTAAFSLAAIPPLAGFAAEWGLLQSLLFAGRELSGGAGLALAATAGVIAIVAGLVLMAFCKLIGMALLGLPRRQACEEATEPGLLRQIPIALGALGVLSVGLAAGAVLPWIEAGVAAPLMGGDSVTGAALKLNFPGSGGLPSLGLAAVLILFGSVIWWLRGPARSAPAETWICGQPQSLRLAWSPAGFVKTLRMSTSLRSGAERAAKGSGPALEVDHTGEVRHVFEWRVHRPLLEGVLALASKARGLQSGRLRAYLLYLAITVVVALTAARLELLG